MDFFDANYWLDLKNSWLSSSLYTTEEKSAAIDNIRSVLADNDIKSLIITSKLAQNYDWDTGNKRLLGSGLSNQLENAFYGFVINPDAYFTYDFDDYVKDAYLNKVRIFKVFPKRQLFYLNDSYMKKIYKTLSYKKFPLMLDLKQLDITGNKYFDIDVLESVLDENKDMPLILETSLKQCMFSRFYFPLLERFENLYLEVSGLLLYDQIEHYVEKFGSKRLIFGSNFPGLPVEINTNRILLANISESDKKNIAFNNLNEIIGGIQVG